ncbi:MAG: HU family DNA-binding protein [Paramuribaculum sp.]|nr:HU family DNA-binding protein [Paramuribaculum sp.]
MDSKQFLARLAERACVSVKDASAMTEALGAALASVCAGLDTAAIPGFGNFTATKRDEEVVTDDVTKKRMLMPPTIVTSFRPSVILRHRLDK